MDLGYFVDQAVDGLVFIKFFWVFFIKFFGCFCKKFCVLTKACVLCKTVSPIKSDKPVTF